MIAGLVERAIFQRAGAAGVSCGMHRGLPSLLEH